MGRKGKKKSGDAEAPTETSAPAAAAATATRPEAGPPAQEDQNFPQLGGGRGGGRGGDRGGGRGGEGGRGGGGGRGGEGGRGGGWGRGGEGGRGGGGGGRGGEGGRGGGGGREREEQGGRGGGREGGRGGGGGRDGSWGRGGDRGGGRGGGGGRERGEEQGGRGGGREGGRGGGGGRGGDREGGRGGGGGGGRGGDREGGRGGGGGRGGDREGGRGGGGGRGGDRERGEQGGRGGSWARGEGGRGRGEGGRGRGDRDQGYQQPRFDQPAQQQQRPDSSGQQQQRFDQPERQERPGSSGQQHQQQPKQTTQTGDGAGPPTKQMEKMSIKDKPSTPKQPSPAKVKADYKGSVSDAIAKSMIAQIPLRKGEGKLGRPIKVLVNMLEIKFGKNFRSDVVHYDVAFDPETPRYLIRPAFEKLQQKNFPTRYPAFDGRKNVFSAGLLPFGESMEKEVEVANEDGRIKTFKITMTKVNDIDISWLVNVRRGLPESERDLISIQALDIILRQAPFQTPNVTPVGRSFFTPPSGRIVQLGDGLELWVGLFQSAVLGWKPFLNIDVAHKGFPVPQKVLHLMGELCGVQDVPTRRDIDYKREDIEKYLKRLKVTSMIPGQVETKRTYTINGLVKCAKDNYFEHQEKSVSVEHYYQIEKRYKIQYPDLPCLHVGPPQKNIHIPAEICTILPGQATNKKMNENQTATMVKYAATPTDVRKSKIMESFSKIRHNQSYCMQEFGLSIGGEFEKINARVLDPPTLTYDRDVRVMKGVWRASRFNAAKNLPDNSWTILCLDNRTREDTLRNLEQMLRKGAHELGMQIGSALTPYGQLQPPTRSLQEVIRFFHDAKAKKLQLVFVVVPDRPPNVYSKVKQVAELNVGVLTQCLKAFTVFKKLNPATIGNILLKVNAKLDGVNHTFKTEIRPRCLRQPCMIVGADVTHPSPDAVGIPSIAAVAASHDPKAFKYNIVIRLQPPRAEIIQNLEEIMIIQLKTFKEKTNQQPLHIVYYRDGVSEGQFPQVMHYELQAIRNACSRLNQSYKPPISFFVVQKRHHIRLFPTDSRNSDDRNNNVQAGTIVDTEITHPSHIDFYLVSHASIQGTARPTKYRCLWDDSKMTEDEIEQLTYYLCHMFSRCTRSVSYPTPTYYAHLAAFRARALTQDVQIDVNNLEHEQRTKLTIKEDFLNNPMFFV